MPTPPDCQPQQIDCDAATRRVHVTWSDGRHSEFPYIWLRHGEFFPLMGRPEQQDVREYCLPEDPGSLAVRDTRVEDGELVIDWGPDRGTTRHQLGFLYEHCLAPESRRQRRPRPRHWDAATAASFPWFDAGDLLKPQKRLQIFLHLRERGIALVRQAPVEPGWLESVAALFGPVRNTHFGSLFDIRSRPEDQRGTGANIGATSSNSIAPHADEGWRHGPPGISLMHCLRADPGGGGSSVFVDGIAAAEILRERDPDAFGFLSRVPLTFAAERNPDERFRTRARVIASDSDGVVRGIRINDRSQSRPDLEPDQVETAYAALRSLYAIILAPERNFEHLLVPGEMVIFDNHRVLHARRAFDPLAGERWIQQLSVDREEFHNRFRQLAEACERPDLSLWEPDAGALSQS